MHAREMRLGRRDISHKQRAGALAPRTSAGSGERVSFTGKGSHRTGCPSIGNSLTRRLEVHSDLP